MDTNNDGTNTQVLLAGAVAAFTVDALVYPLDTIKTRYQSQQYATQPGAGAKVPGSLFRGVYQGIGSVVVATLPAAGVFFLTYESAKSALGTALPSAVPQAAVHALASGAAELASCSVLTPAEVIKQNAQVLRDSASGAGRQSSSLRALHLVWHSEGGPTRKLWAGYKALAARNLPFTALQFPMFEFLRGRLGHGVEQSTGTRSANGDQVGWRARVDGATSGRHLSSVGAVNAAAAAMSGATAALITTPLDVVKTRIMLASGSAPEGGAVSRATTGKLTGLIVAKTVYREAGIRGLFRGATLRIIWTALGSGIYLGSYEMAKVWLKGGRAADGRNSDTSV
ncbi:mitochondrial carrier domain-containing protein [Podospora conica]|nr:mitochondrial carrier domain-containing protein [Schizothecium conicum]